MYAIKINGYKISIANKYKDAITMRTRKEDAFIMLVKMGEVRIIDITHDARMCKMALSIVKNWFAMGGQFLHVFVWKNSAWSVLSDYAKVAELLSVRTKKDYDAMRKNQSIRARNVRDREREERKREMDYRALSRVDRKTKARKARVDASGDHRGSMGTRISERAFNHSVVVYYNRVAE